MKWYWKTFAKKWNQLPTALNQLSVFTTNFKSEKDKIEWESNKTDCNLLLKVVFGVGIHQVDLSSETAIKRGETTTMFSKNFSSTFDKHQTTVAKLWCYFLNVALGYVCYKMFGKHLWYVGQSDDKE